MSLNSTTASASTDAVFVPFVARDQLAGSSELPGTDLPDACLRQANLSMRVEWPTLLLLAGVYVGWICLIAFYELLPVWIVLPALTVLTTLHSSLQHEALHGHPTRNARLNELLAAVPLGLFIPYRRFKHLHLRHHCDENLTDPYDDPESFYLSKRDWLSMPLIARYLLRANNTLLGRLALGPALSLFAFYREEAARLADHTANRHCLLVSWIWHMVGAAGVIALISSTGFPIFYYLLGVAYPAMSLLMLRTYAEHQATKDVGSRTAIVDASPFFALLYLNNNLHFVHHRFPNAPWYQLPKIYRLDYAGLNNDNGHYKIPGYWTLFRRYFIRSKEPVEHPLRRTETLLPTNLGCNLMKVAVPKYQK